MRQGFTVISESRSLSPQLRFLRAYTKAGTQKQKPLNERDPS